MRAYHRTSFPSPLSGIKGTINAPTIGNNMDKLNQGKSAEIGSEINIQSAENDLKEAKLAINKFSEDEKSPAKIKALNEISKAEARIQASKN